MNTGEKIRQLRKSSGLSQEQLAEKLGVSRQAVSKWETCSSQPDTDKLYAMSKLFGVSVESFIAPETDTTDSGETETNENFDTAEPKSHTVSLKVPIAVCAVGIVGIVICILITLLFPESASRLSGSSVITIDGTGLLIFIFAVFSAAGGFTVFRRLKK